MMPVSKLLLTAVVTTRYQ